MTKGGSLSWVVRLSLLAVAFAVSGCASYSWRPKVPEGFRSVSVPTFRNESNVTELGSVMTRQLLREFQREGTFTICRVGEAALEVQGVVKSTSVGTSGYDRRSGLRLGSYDFSALVEVSVVDKYYGRVLINNRLYRVSTTFTASQDVMTAARDASGRLADELARQVVDDMTNLKIKEGSSNEQ